MSYARAAELLGSVGAGQLTKMVNQICIAGLVQGLSEGLNFAVKRSRSGRAQAVVDVISKGAAGSWQMENRGTRPCWTTNFEHLASRLTGCAKISRFVLKRPKIMGRITDHPNR